MKHINYLSGTTNLLSLFKCWFTGEKYSPNKIIQILQLLKKYFKRKQSFNNTQILQDVSTVSLSIEKTGIEFNEKQGF